VCARGADRALLCGPSTSPLGDRVDWLGITAFVLLAAGVVALIVGGATGSDFHTVGYSLLGAGTLVFVAAYVVMKARGYHDTGDSGANGDDGTIGPHHHAHHDGIDGHDGGGGGFDGGH
jgi:hypothetical protein